jgi:dATP pyrophosphohydrolase
VAGAPGPEPSYKRPESVLVVVFTQRGEVLLLERTQPRGFWQSVTGSLEWGESARAAARRELREETGLVAGCRLVDLKRQARFAIISPWRSRYAPGTNTNTEYWFALGLPDRRLVRRRPSEHRQHRWLPWPLAWRLATSWTNRAAIAHLFLR